jgi:hypothetical protein
MDKEMAGMELVAASDSARVSDLIEDFKKCTPWRGGFNRLDWNAQIRDAVWDGQAADGRKHDSENAKAFPFEGASDARVFAADDICNDHVALCVVGFFRAMVRFAGVEAKDGELAGDATRFMERLLEGPGFAALLEEVELSAQLMAELGIFVLQPTMEREVAYELREVSMKELAAAAGIQGDASGGADAAGATGPVDPTAQGGNPLALKLIQLVMNPAAEDQAIEFVQEMGAMIVQEELKEFLGVCDMQALEEWTVSLKRAREFVRGLREDGYGSLPTPVVLCNEVTVAALRPWDEVFFRGYAVDLAKQSRVYRREFMEPVELKARAAMNGWDPKWVEETLKTRGKVSEWSGNSLATTLASSDWTSDGRWAAVENQEDLIEVIYGFQRCIEEDGVLSYWLTVFSAHATPGDAGASRADAEEFCAKHEQVSADEMCFVMGLRERRGRGVGRVRGVPEVVSSRQREMKCHRDALVDLGSMAVMPPLNVPFNAMKIPYQFGPGVRNVVQPGLEPRFMEVPTTGAPLAVEMHDRLKRELDEEFGRGGPEVDPTRTAGKRQMVLNAFLGAWTVGLQGMWRLALKFTSPEEYQRITGGPMPTSREARRGEDLILHFDVRDLDMEFVKATYAAFKELVTIDAGGVLDKSKLVNVMARMINPSLAREVVSPAAAASQQLFRQVKGDVMGMALGLEPEYGQDDDPTAQAKLQFLDQIFKTSGKMQERLKADPDFQEKLLKYAENLKFNVAQQENKMIGRVGVQPGE